MEQEWDHYSQPLFDMILSTFLLIVSALLSFLNGAAAIGPIVKLDNGTFTGITAGGVSQFLGIPFAQPP